ncbi:MAG: anti-sigma factor [Armatimonadota bacterium]|nr:anti-sigma factor [Armatimonadota bacterium]
MRSARLALMLSLAAMFVLGLRAQAADVYNVDLKPVGDQGVSGLATIISAKVSGTSPYYNVEVNARADKAPPANMVYEAWFVDNDANYKLSLGAFTGMRFSARTRLVRFSDAMPFDMLAVSLEPADDSNPMPTTIVAQGNLPGSRVSAADFSRVAVLPEDEAFLSHIITQRFGLSSDTANDLRMRGWSYSDIAVMANAAYRCNRQVSEVASMLESGKTWSDIAQSCNMTVAELLTPVPRVEVAGALMELPSATAPSGVVAPLLYYKRGANNAPLITQQKWNELRVRGYDWQSVAIAANIAAETGESVDDLLRIRRIQGLPWQTIIIDRALDMKKMMDVSGWPFSKDEEEMQTPPPLPTAPAQ